MNDQDILIPHLFRTEYSKIVAVLCKHFGLRFLSDAEDIASDTFVTAMLTWPFKGIPLNPTAWLYTVAKHKASNHALRRNLFETKIRADIEAHTTMVETFDLNLSHENIDDSQLRMMFAICHPTLQQEAQVALALRILCGFGIDEIATAFLTTKDTINKRLFRAKEKIRTEHIELDFPRDDKLTNRLESVLMMLYLLFNEGYYSETNEEIIREDLCFEAMRLTHLLTHANQTNTPSVNALFSLMCFHASRLKARKDDFGDIILYNDQDESKWDQELITQGARYLSAASTGSTLTNYHLEATIAYWHTQKEDTPEKWNNILSLYNRLLIVKYSPVAALNRTYALSKVKTNADALIELKKLQLTNNHYYFVLLGEFYRSIDPAAALENLEKAYQLAKTKTDQQTIRRKIDQINLFQRSQ